MNFYIDIFLCYINLCGLSGFHTVLFLGPWHPSFIHRYSNFLWDLLSFICFHLQFYYQGCIYVFIQDKT